MWLHLVFLMGIALVPQADAVGDASKCHLDDLLDDIGDIVETESTSWNLVTATAAAGSMLAAGVQTFEDCFAYAKSDTDLVGTISTALTTAQTKIKEAFTSANVEKLKTALKGMWDSFKDYVTSMIDAAKIRTRSFADLLESRMLLLTDPAETESYDKVFTDMSTDDINDLVNVLEDYINEEADDEDTTATGLWTIKGRASATVSAGGGGRRLAAALTRTEKETVIRASFDARAGMEVESNARMYPETHNVRRCKRRCNRRVVFRSRDLAAAKTACDEVTGVGGLLPAGARHLAEMRAACASVATEKGCTSTSKRHFIRVMRYSMKRVVVVKQKRTVTSKKVIAGGQLDFEFKTGTTVVDKQMHADMKAVIAKSLDVDAAWVYTKVAQVCRPMVVKRPAPKPRDGRRRAPKRGDGRRRRRSKKKKHRDAHGCDGRRRAPPKCHCGCGCGARRRHKGKKHKYKRLLTEVDSDDLLGFDLIDSGDYWHVDNSSDVVAVEAVPEEFTPARRLDDDDDDDKDRYKKHKKCKKCKRGKEPALTVVKQRCTRKKGVVGVKVFYDVRIPAYEEEVDVQVRSKVRMQTQFKNTVKTHYATCGCQSSSKLNFKFEGKAKAEFNYLERPRKARRSLTAALKGRVDMVSEASWDMRTKFRANLRTKMKAIKGIAADSKASLAASLKILTDRDDMVQCGCDKSNDVNFKIEAKGMAKVKVIKTKVDKGEDLTEEESAVVVKAAAMAQVEVDYKQKVEQDDNARVYDKYYRLLLKGKASFTDAATSVQLKSADFRDRCEKSFTQISASMTAVAKTRWESGMQKLAKGDTTLTDEETKEIQVSLKAGTEIEVARVDKERFDFAVEVGGTIDIRGLSADQKEECSKAFEDAVSLYTGADCGNLKKTTIKCATGDKKKCWSVTTKYRVITDAMNLFCKTGCFNGEEQKPECSSTSALVSKKCSCCDGQSEMTVEDECEDVNEVWGLVAEGDFESFTEQQTKTFQKVLAEGKAWADKKYKAYRSSVAKKYSDCEDYLRNIVDWSEVSAAMKADIKAAVASVKAKKSQVYYYLTETEWALVDKAVEDVECSCKTDLPHEEKMVLRVTLDVAVKLEIAKTGEVATADQQAEMTDKTVLTKLKLKVKGAAAADLKTKEAKASIAGAFKAAFGAKSEHLVTVKDPTTLRRRLVDCETGRCLQETTVEIPVQQTIPKIEGDLDTMTEKNILTADKVALQESLQENMKAAGAKGEVTVDTVGDPETTECESDCVPKKQASLAGEPDLAVDTNVNSAPRKAFSAFAATALILCVAAQ